MWWMRWWAHWMNLQHSKRHCYYHHHHQPSSYHWKLPSHTHHTNMHITHPSPITTTHTHVTHTHMLHHHRHHHPTTGTPFTHIHHTINVSYTLHTHLHHHTCVTHTHTLHRQAELCRWYKESVTHHHFFTPRLTLTIRGCNTWKTADCLTRIILVWAIFSSSSALLHWRYAHPLRMTLANI